MEIKFNNVTPEQTVILNFILDESGSMKAQQQAVISGFNEYIETMKADQNKVNYVVNLIKFGDEAQVVFAGKPLHEVREITTHDYNPFFWTALRDGIGRGIELTDSQMYLFRDATALFFIFTDGYENKSRRYSADELKRMITEREAKGGWTFTFVGASKECLGQAADLGISLGNTIPYNYSNAYDMVRSMSAATVTYAANSVSGAYGDLKSTGSLWKDAGFDNSRPVDEQVPPPAITITTTSDN